MAILVVGMFLEIYLTPQTLGGGQFLYRNTRGRLALFLPRFAVHGLWASWVVYAVPPRNTAAVVTSRLRRSFQTFMPITRTLFVPFSIEPVLRQCSGERCPCDLVTIPNVEHLEDKSTPGKQTTGKYICLLCAAANT